MENQIINYSVESKFDIEDILYVIDSNLIEYEVMITGKILGLYVNGNYINYISYVIPISIYIVQRKIFEFKDSDINNFSLEQFNFRVFSSKELMLEFKNKFIDSKIEELNSKR